MTKLVVVKFADGSFEVGFTVALQIGEEGELPSAEITGKLPPASEMPLYYSHWQSSYRQLGNCYRLSSDKVQKTNVSVTQDCHNSAKILKARFNTWLQSEEFRPVREKWLEKLQSTDEVRVVLQTRNSQLQRLPWHCWDLLERYPHAEIALASPVYERLNSVKTCNNKVNILAIIGNSQGIDTEADQVLLQQLPNADVTFLVEPGRQELTDKLWGQKWDILFFAGHSSSRGKDGIGRIFLNKNDNLTIEELRYALRKAVERGLQLAVFNSCDGLGLAQELADLQIPQIIVMREPVPDVVAQEFLKYFLSGYAGGECFYQVVRQARERLQGLEDRFPCATWLPVICQNPAAIPPSWQEITGFIQPPPAPPPQQQRSPRRHLARGLFSTLAVTALVFGLRFVGLMQGAELQVFDAMMRSRSIVMDEGVDPRLVVVTIDDADLAAQRRNGELLKGTSLSDKSLSILLAKLQQYQPRAIGLDIYRDFPAEERDLISRLQKTDNLIGICKGSDAVTNIHGTKPPPEIPQERLGFSDFIHDPDGVVRRHLLWMNQEATSLCSAPNAFSVQLASLFLAAKGIQPKYTTDGNLQFGNTVFHRLGSRAGGYQSIDANGGQILVNYRSTKTIAEQVTLTQLLSSPLNPSAVKDKIVLIGVTARGDSPDSWATPYGTQLDKQMPGVMVQAHMISQILSAVLDGRSLLRTLSPLVEFIWLWGWSVVGVVLAWRWRSVNKLILVVCSTSGIVYLFCFGLLIQGVWVPFVPSILVLVGTASVFYTQNSKLS